MNYEKQQKCDCHEKIINFLQIENKQLKESNNEYIALVNLNKEIIKNFQQQNNDLLISQISQTGAGVHIMSNTNNQNIYNQQGNGTINNANSQILNNNSINNKDVYSNINNNHVNQQQSSYRYAQAPSTVISSMQTMRINPLKDKSGLNTYKGEKTTAYTTNKSESNKVYEILFGQIVEENQKLYEIIQRVSKQRDLAQSKVLINEQIAEGIEQQEKELVNDYSEKITTMNKIIQDQSDQIHQLINARGQTNFGTYIRYKEVIVARDAEVKLHNRLENCLKLIKSLEEKVQFLEDDKQELIYLNGVFGQQIEKLQFQINTFNEKKKQSCSAIHLSSEESEADQPEQKLKEKKIQVKSSKKIISQDKSIENVKKMVNLQSEESEDLFIPDYLPEKVKLKSELTKIVIPSLDLTKAKKIQEINLQRQLEQLKQKEQMQATQQLQQQISKDNSIQQINPHVKNADNMNLSRHNELDMKLLEKYKIVEAEMYKSKAFLEEEILRQQAQQKLLDESERQVSELQSVNQTLVESNMMFQQKWKKLWDSYMFYREYYIRDSRKTYKQKNFKSCDSRYKTNNQIQYNPQNFIFATQSYEQQFCQGNNIQEINDFCSPESLCRQAQRNKVKQPVFLIQSPKGFQHFQSQENGYIYQNPQNQQNGYPEANNMNQPHFKPLSEEQLLEIASEYFLSQRCQKVPEFYDLQQQKNYNYLQETRTAMVNMALELYLDSQRRSVLQRISEGKKFRKRSKSMDFMLKELDQSQDYMDSNKKSNTFKRIRENQSRIKFPPAPISQNQSIQYQGMTVQNTNDNKSITTINAMNDFKNKNSEMRQIFPDHIHHCCFCSEKKHNQCHDFDQGSSLQYYQQDRFQIFEELIEQINEQEVTLPKQTKNSFTNLKHVQQNEKMNDKNSNSFSFKQNQNTFCSQFTPKQINQFSQDNYEQIRNHTRTGDIITNSIDANVLPDGVGLTEIPNPNRYNKYFKTEIQKHNSDYISNELNKLNNSNNKETQNIIQELTEEERNRSTYMINVIQTHSNIVNKVSLQNSSNSIQVIHDESHSFEQRINSDQSSNALAQQQSDDKENKNIQNQKYDNSIKKTDPKGKEAQESNIIHNNTFQLNQNGLQINNQSDQDDNKQIQNDFTERSEILQESKFMNNANFNPSESKANSQQKYQFNGQEERQKESKNTNKFNQDISQKENQGLNQNFYSFSQTGNINQAKSDCKSKSIEVSDLNLIVFD